MPSNPEIAAKLNEAFGRLSYSEAAHRYTLDGGRLPSVTTIIGRLDKSTPLLIWAAKLAQETGNAWAFREAKQKAADLGHETHSLVEAELYAMLGWPFAAPDVSDDAHYVFSGWKQWAASVNLCPVVVELPLFSSSLGYAGRLDVLGLVNGVLTVIDWKTSGKGVVYEEHRLQSYAYRNAVGEALGERPAGMVVLLPKESVSQGSTFSGITPVDIPWSDSGFEAFKGLLSVHKWCAESQKEERARTK